MGNRILPTGHATSLPRNRPQSSRSRRRASGASSLSACAFRGARAYSSTQGKWHRGGLPLYGEFSTAAVLKQRRIHFSSQASFRTQCPYAQYPRLWDWQITRQKGTRYIVPSANQSIPAALEAVHDQFYFTYQVVMSEESYCSK